jgi:cardiolipin synthase
VNRSDIPNLITILRILLVPPIAYLLYWGDYDIALLLFLGAGLSDALDGFLAKHYGWMSRLGGLLDPIADKALLMSSFIVLAWVDLIPVWLVVVVVLRDVIISGSKR